MAEIIKPTEQGIRNIENLVRLGYEARQEKLGSAAGKAAPGSDKQGGASSSGGDKGR